MFGFNIGSRKWSIFVISTCIAVYIRSVNKFFFVFLSYGVFNYFFTLGNLITLILLKIYFYIIVKL